jgi:tellurite resistance protein
VSDSAGGGAAIPAPTPRRYFEYLPVGVFGSVLGLTGLSVTWHLAGVRYGAPAWIAQVLAVVAALAFVAIATAYTLKAVTAPDAVRTEFRNPIAVNLFASIWVSLLLLPLVLAPVNLMLARVLWSIGAIGITGLAWYILDRWLGMQQQHVHVTPAWLLPVAGALDVPLAVRSLDLPQLHWVMVAALAVGLFFAIPLYTMIFNRLVFEAPLPPALQPTLLILGAPTAVGVSSYLATTGGEFDLFAKSLYAVTVFQYAVLLGRLRHLPRSGPFKLGWWAVSFPLAAGAIAALHAAQAAPHWATHAIAVTAWLLATLVILGLLGRTVLGIARGELRALSS